MKHVALHLYQGLTLGAAVGLLCSWLVTFSQIAIWLVWYWCTSIVVNLTEVGMGSGLIGGVLGAVIQIGRGSAVSTKALYWISIMAGLTACVGLGMHLRFISVHPCTVSF
jgi:hypothetical protein